MSLYKHGGRQGRPARRIVALLRAEIPADLPPGDWREAIRQLAGSLRDLVHRHPAAAPLLTSRQGLQEHLLRVCQGVLRLIREGGVPEVCAVALLRTVFPSGIGFALAELFLPEPPPPGPDSEMALIRQVTGLLSPQAPDELVRTALLVCGDYDIASQFHIGVDLMVRGLNAYLATLAADTPGEGGKGSAPAWHGRGARGPVTAPAVTSGQGWCRPPFA